MHLRCHFWPYIFLFAYAGDHLHLQSRKVAQNASVIVKTLLLACEVMRKIYSSTHQHECLNPRTTPLP